MANVLGKRLLKMADEFQKFKTDGNRNFLDYYMEYLTEHFVWEHLEPDEVIPYMDEKLDSIRNLSVEEQNLALEDIARDTRDFLADSHALKNSSTFDALDFLAITMLGRMVGHPNE